MRTAKRQIRMMKQEMQNMGLKIWIDDKLVDQADAKISVFDHGLLYGDGVFEGIRVYNSKVFELEAHIKRLYKSARAIRLEVPMSQSKLIGAVKKTVDEVCSKFREYVTEFMNLST